MNDNNPAYLQAANDYCPQLARVDHAAIARLPRPALELLQGHGVALSETPAADNPLAAATYLLAMGVLNYQFWSQDPKGGFVRYQHQGLTGALAMEAGFSRLWRGALPSCPLSRGVLELCVQNMRDDLAAIGPAHYFGSIPAKETRVALLNEILNPVRLLNVAQHLVNRMELENELTWADAQYLAHLFPQGYADPYLKKAQLALMRLAGHCTAIRGTQVTLDVSAAADYQLPKVLRALGVLDYSEELASAVDTGILLEVESNNERAIRAATLYACDALAEQFGMDIAAVDSWLWAQRNAAVGAAFHLTETTWY